MNPFFFILVFLAAVLLWFLLSFAFPWIGKIALKLWKDAEYNINKEDQERNDNNEG